MNVDAPAPIAHWVLLRGLTREAGHWADFPVRLQAALPGTRVHALDLPGNGLRHRERSPVTVQAMVQAVRHQLRADGVPPPYRLLAMSLGAMVAVEWASRHPEEIGAAVLINTSMRPLNPWWQRLRPVALAPLLGLLLPGRSAHAREAVVLRLTSRRGASRPGSPTRGAGGRGPTDEADAVVAAWAALRQAHPVRASNAVRQLLAAARYRAPPSAPAVPMLVLIGAADALVHPACSRELARRWGLPAHEHPEAGHDLVLDDPDGVISRVLAWVASIGARDAASSAGG
jgi:pimeloyl-ACP methyl ester carboxylesterase